jgi:hypothetical protein
MSVKRRLRLQRPKSGEMETAVMGDVMSDEEFEMMMAAGEGLFWERQGEKLKLFSPDMVHLGIETMWEMWYRIDAMLPAKAA